MAPPPAKPIRKRNRKRKRRAASSSSSSSDSNSSDSESVSPQKPAPVVTTQASEPSSSSSSSSESDSEDSDAPQRVESSKETPGKAQIKQVPPQGRSPSPQPVPIPSFLPSQTEAAEAAEQEKVLKERFRRFWMSSIADGFKDDLEEIRKEPNLDKSRLALLIDSLASGAEVYSSSLKDGKDINEMEVVLDS
ncbi:Ribosome assembly protein 3 [Pleurotus pulmonarius]